MLPTDGNVDLFSQPVVGTSCVAAETNDNDLLEDAGGFSLTTGTGNFAKEYDRPHSFVIGLTYNTNTNS